MSAALAKRIRDLRHARGLGKFELARRAGIGEATIWRIERGDGVNTDTIELVFSVLGVDPWAERETPASCREEE